MSILAQLTSAIYGQESSHGKADTSQPNYAGARGPMQVTHSTFEGMKAKGLIPVDWKHDNPEQTKTAGERLVAHLYEKFGGDARKVAAAYYSGEGVVRKDGTIANYRDKKNAKAPTTHQYADAILARMGIAGQADEITSGDLGNLGDPLNRAMPAPISTDPSEPKPVAAPAPIAPAPDPATGGDWGAGAAASAARTHQAIAEQTNTSASEMIGQASLWNTIPGTVFRSVMRPDYEPVPGFDPRRDVKDLYTMRSEDVMADLDASVSPEHAQRIIWEDNERQTGMRTQGASGSLAMLAANFAAGAPEGLIMGLGAMKAFQLAKVGAAALAAEGRAGAAIASAVAENVGGNLAGTAALDVLGDHQQGSDYAMAVGFGLLGAGLSARGLIKTADSAALGRIAERHMQAAAEQATADLEVAKKNLGIDADPVALRAEVSRIEASRLQERVQAAQTSVEADRRLLPDDEAVPEASLDRGMDRDAETTAYVPQQADSFTRMAGLDRDAVRAQETKFAMSKGATEAISLRPAATAVQKLVEKLLPEDHRIVLTTNVGSTPDGRIPRGATISSGNLHVISLNPDNTAPDAIRTGIHEVGHILEKVYLPNATPELRTAITSAIKKIQDDILDRKPEGAGERLSPTRRTPEDKTLAATKYNLDGSEITAEQFVKYVENDAALGGDRFQLGKVIVERLKQYVQSILDLFREAKQEAYLPPNEAFEKFFDEIVKGRIQAVGSEGKVSYDVAPNPKVSSKYGLDLLPMDTDTQRAEYKAMVHLYEKAERWAEANPMDKDYERRVDSLADNSLFNVASTSLIMLKSKNPVVRMIAAELLESPSGAGGRQSTAALSKFMAERQFMGNAINEFQYSYRVWRNAQGGNIVGDFFGGEKWHEFNRKVAAEIESRAPGRTSVNSPDEVKKAADVLEAGYERMRQGQLAAKTAGWNSLPETSRGYMPHRMSAEKILNLTNAQARALHSALTDQFVGIEGFDLSFADKLASKYIDRVQQRARGGYEAGVGVHQVGAADVVKEALEAMGMTKPEVDAAMGRYMRGAAGHTKRRLKLDLNAEHVAEDGTTFRLLDLFETDQFVLLRSQAQRVSGEVALAGHGVMGKSGLTLLRRAMQFGEDGKKAESKEIEAFDQVAAEFLGQPFGNVAGKWLDRAMTANSLARLGGMGFTQAAEYINGIAHLGAARTMSAVAGMPRLIGELRTLARGEKVNNPIIGSIEQVGGAEFGTDAYKLVFPFDAQGHAYNTYGKDTLTATDRLLRGASHVQGKLSFWRAIHGAQTRGMAEQIVRKAVRYIAEGKEDIALSDMGFTPELVASIRADLPNTATLSGDALTSFDLTKSKMTPAEVKAFVQAVHRGTAQIIQGTYIGETGKWAHDGWLRLLTQFRSFSITSMEKQWTRQVSNHGGGPLGTAKAMGILLGSMSIAAPIYMARVYLASQGRPDQQEYLDKQLAPAQVARATMNYVAMSGLAGDMMDAFTAVSGVGEVTGGRTGAASAFVGNVVAPAAGYADDIWRSVQNSKEGTDPKELLKVLPFANLPYMIPIVNGLAEGVKIEAD